jgi:cell division protein FtsQ
VPLIGDQKIILGNARRLENKFDRLKTFYKKAMPYVGWQQYRSINLKFNGQVVCKR